MSFLFKLVLRIRVLIKSVLRLANNRDEALTSTSWVQAGTALHTSGALPRQARYGQINEAFFVLSASSALPRQDRYKQGPRFVLREPYLDKLGTSRDRASHFGSLSIQEPYLDKLGTSSGHVFISTR